MTIRLEGARPLINVTPLIDVLLVLLIIFMVVVPARPHQLETRVPTASKQEVRPDLSLAPVAVRISILCEIFLDQQRTNPSDLSRDLSKLFARRPVEGRKVLILAPADMDYRFVVSIIDMVKGAGATDTALALAVDSTAAPVPR